MFELNKNLEVKEDFLLGSKIYTVDNFYKDPEEVSDYLFNREVLYGNLKKDHLIIVCILMIGD